MTYSNQVDFSHEVANGETKWTEASVLSAPKGKRLSVKDKNSSIRGIGFKKFQAWDSNLDFLTGSTTRNILPIQVDIQPLGNNEYILSKILPDSFFATRPVYPVYTDTTTTFYPDPDAETTTVDGVVQRSVADTTWAGVRDGAGTSANDSNTGSGEYYAEMYSGNSSNTWGRIKRAIFLFDTSSIGDTDTIDSAVLSLYGIGKNDPNGATPNIDIYTSTPASNTALVGADYGQIGTTSQTGSPISYSSYSTSAYNDFTFNATGRGNVSKTSISKFGARIANYDAANTAPTWVTGDSWSLQGYYADQTGTSNDPKLVVTYTPANAAPTAPTSLRTEGQTNPVE